MPCNHAVMAPIMARSFSPGTLMRSGTGSPNESFRVGSILRGSHYQATIADYPPLDLAFSLERNRSTSCEVICLSVLRRR